MSSLFSAALFYTLYRVLQHTVGHFQLLCVPWEYGRGIAGYNTAPAFSQELDCLVSHQVGGRR